MDPIMGTDIISVKHPREEKKILGPSNLILSRSDDRTSKNSLIINICHQYVPKQRDPKWTFSER